MNNILNKVIFEVRSPVLKAQLIGAVAGGALPFLIGTLCYIFAAGVAGLALYVFFSGPAVMLCHAFGSEWHEDAAHFNSNLWLIGVTDAFVGFLLGTVVGLCVRRASVTIDTGRPVE